MCQLSCLEKGTIPPGRPQGTSRYSILSSGEAPSCFSDASPWSLGHVCLQPGLERKWMGKL